MEVDVFHYNSVYRVPAAAAGAMSFDPRGTTILRDRYRLDLTPPFLPIYPLDN